MTTQLRIGHLSPDAPAVNVTLDGEIVAENVSFGTLGEFTDVDARTSDVSIRPASGGDAVLTATLDHAADVRYTVAATGELSAIDALVLTDDQPTIADDESRVRFVHTVPDAPAVDVFAGEDRLIENVAFGEASAFLTIPSGAFDLRVRPTGETDSVLELSGVEFDDATGYTVFATGTLADDSLDALLVSESVSADEATPAAR